MSLARDDRLLAVEEPETAFLAKHCLTNLRIESHRNKDTAEKEVVLNCFFLQNLNSF